MRHGHDMLSRFRVRPPERGHKIIRQRAADVIRTGQTSGGQSGCGYNNSSAGVGELQFQPVAVLEPIRRLYGADIIACVAAVHEIFVERIGKRLRAGFQSLLNRAEIII